MRKITVLCVGKLKESHWKDAEAEFLKRLSPYIKVQVIEVSAEPLSATVTASMSIAAEGKRLLAKLPNSPTSQLITMEKEGRNEPSEKFAQRIEKMTEMGDELIFVIGGAAGLSPEISARAAHKLSLSEMTFTHEMARIFLLEQLYRAETILRGKAYHY